MLPELAFLLLHLQTALPAVMLLLIYLVAVLQLSLYSAMLYLPRITVERYMLLVFVLFFASLLFLAAFPLWQFAIVLFIISISLFRLFYECWEAFIAN
jgi:hypothetical protein